jgi:hypothetical protein
LESGQKERGEGNAKKVCLEMNTIPMRPQVQEIAVGTSKGREEKREAVVKSFFFSLALCIQNKSSGSCCNYLRVPHTTVRGTAVAVELLQSEFNHKQEETKAKTV